MENLVFLTALVESLKKKTVALDRELAPLRKKASELAAQQIEIVHKINEKERGLAAITENAVEGYKTLCQSLGPHDPFPCPTCFVIHNQKSHLAPGTDSAKCKTCKEVFPLPFDDD